MIDSLTSTTIVGGEEILVSTKRIRLFFMHTINLFDSVTINLFNGSVTGDWYISELSNSTGRTIDFGEEGILFKDGLTYLDSSVTAVTTLEYSIEK